MGVLVEHLEEPEERAAGGHEAQVDVLEQEQDFPRYVEAFSREKIRPVAPPTKDVVSDTDVVAAHDRC